MININYQYRDLLADVLEHGEEKEDRTGVGTISLFGPQMEFDLQDGFPAVTIKKLYFKMVVDELLWFISGSTNINDLPERTRKIWEPWALPDGNLGPVYGKQFRRVEETKIYRAWSDEYGKYIQEGDIYFHDPLKVLIEDIKKFPYSRRNVISLWDDANLHNMQLPPCHGIAIQFYVRNGQSLDCKMYQRSADCGLGVPFNIASYSLLTHMVASLCDLNPGRFIHTMGDAHIYKNHLAGVEEMLQREPLPLPTLEMNERDSIDDFVVGDFELKNYEHRGAVELSLAV